MSAEGYKNNHRYNAILTSFIEFEIGQKGLADRLVYLLQKSGRYLEIGDEKHIYATDVNDDRIEIKDISDDHRGIVHRLPDGELALYFTINILNHRNDSYDNFGRCEFECLAKNVEDGDPNRQSLKISCNGIEIFQDKDISIESDHLKIIESVFEKVKLLAPKLAIKSTDAGLEKRKKFQELYNSSVSEMYSH